MPGEDGDVGHVEQRIDDRVCGDAPKCGHPDADKPRDQADDHRFRIEHASDVAFARTD